MKINLVKFLVSFVLISCHNRSLDNLPSHSMAEIDTSKTPQKNMMLDNKLTLAIDPANLGELITTVQFNVQVKNKDKGDLLPYISLENPDSEIDRLVEPDELVVPYKVVTLVIDYPLDNAATFEVRSTGDGFTRRQLAKAISEKYHLIYKEEEASAIKKVINQDKREGVINRNDTDGKYGIWGHDLSDLDLSTIEVYRGKDDKIYLSLQIES